MERDNFEEKIKQLVVKADQAYANSSNRERVWKNINRPKQTSKIWYYIAATIILCLTIGLLTLPKEEPETLGIVRVVKKPNPVPQPEMQKLVIQQPLKASHSKKTKHISVIDTIIEQKTLVNPRVDEQVRQTEVVSITGPTVSNTSIEPNMPKEPIFTVQFKRGSVPVQQAVGAAPIRIALKKFSFKRDTAYYANNEKVSRNLLKIKF